MHVKPKPGVKVRCPETKQHLPPEGKDVQPSSYWVRRLLDGDVLLVKPIPDSKPPEVKP